MISIFNKRCCPLVFVSLLILLTTPSVIFADEFAPALLQINERDGGWVDVTWKIPVRQNRGLGLTPVLPDFLEPVGPSTGKQFTGAWVEHSTYRTGGRTLTGEILSIEGARYYSCRCRHTYYFARW